MRHLLAFVFVSCCGALAAQPLGPAFSRDAVGERTYPPAPRLAAQVEIAPAVVLPAAAKALPETLDAMRQWNDSGRVPLKNGFVRSIVDPLAVTLPGDVAMKQSPASYGRGVVSQSSRGIVWSGSVRVENARELRLHFEEVTLPAGTVMWVYGNAGDAFPFDSALVDDRGGLWTPSVEGDTLHFEIEVPRGATAASFIVREVAEIVQSNIAPVEHDVSCLVDAACIGTSTFSNIDALKGAVAQLEFIDGGSSYVCSGALLNDRAGDFTPYLLTANHCFSNQTSASSLQAYWSFIRSTCNGSLPSRSSFSRSVGSTLLAGSSNSDFTFVRLGSVPAGRWFLGWVPSAASLTNGMKLYRVSHPFPNEYSNPLPQAYSTTTYDTASSTCLGVPRPRFLYSHLGTGSTWGGSSGSAVVNANAQVVGQLYGICSASTPDCDARLQNVDGAFSETYGSITQWIENGNAVQPNICTQNTTTLCLSGDRFAVSATWKTGNQNGSGQAVRLTGDTGYFWFFGSSNVEVVIKVLNACGFNSKFWVFAGGLTDVNVVLTVRDTKTGSVRTYTNPIDTAFKPIQDTDAFATCP